MRPKTSGAAASSAGSSKIAKRYSNIFGNLDLIVYHSSITECESSIQALVNCTGPKFQAHGGISKALMSACGVELTAAIQDYLSKNGGYLKQGIVATTGAYALSFKHKHILHISSPILNKRYMHVNNALVSTLQLTYERLLRTAFVELGLDSIGMPLIGTGLAGIPVDESVNDLIEAMRAFTADGGPNRPCSLYIVNFDRKVVDHIIRFIYEKLQYIQAATTQGAENIQSKNGDSPNKVEKSFQADDEDCVICLDKIDPNASKKLELCGHKFCRACIDDYFTRVKKVCPICQRVYAVVDGTQPTNGTMHWKILNMSLPGFEQAKTIEIVYSIPNGVQTAEHPHPGRPYHGCVRTAYLPDTNEGRRVLALLERAFRHRLIFTIGQSRTTGFENCVTWNDIHHKTSVHGGPTGFGYPDANYLARVTEELASKGIN